MPDSIENAPVKYIDPGPDTWIRRHFALFVPSETLEGLDTQRRIVYACVRKLYYIGYRNDYWDIISKTIAVDVLNNRTVISTLDEYIRESAFDARIVPVIMEHGIREGRPGIFIYDIETPKQLLHRILFLTFSALHYFIRDKEALEAYLPEGVLRQDARDSFVETLDALLDHKHIKKLPKILIDLACQTRQYLAQISEP